MRYAMHPISIIFYLYKKKIWFTPVNYFNSIKWLVVHTIDLMKASF